jgi:ABC-type iron transport system FetAB permease component
MEFNLYDVLAALALVGVAVGLSLYQKVKLEKDILIGTIRSF